MPANTQRKPSTKWLNGNTLHIEAPGCVINVHVGLHNRDGQDVTSVTIQCDQYAGEPKWTLPDYNDAKHLNVRVLRGEVSNAS